MKTAANYDNATLIVEKARQMAKGLLEIEHSCITDAEFREVAVSALKIISRLPPEYAE